MTYHMIISCQTLSKKIYYFNNLNISALNNLFFENLHQKYLFCIVPKKKNLFAVQEVF